MMAPEPLCVGVVKTGNSATVSGPQLEVETPHPASARAGGKRKAVSCLASWVTLLVSEC